MISLFSELLIEKKVKSSFLSPENQREWDRGGYFGSPSSHTGHLAGLTSLFHPHPTQLPNFQPLPQVKLYLPRCSRLPAFPKAGLRALPSWNNRAQYMVNHHCKESLLSDLCCSSFQSWYSQQQGFQPLWCLCCGISTSCRLR